MSEAAYQDLARLYAWRDIPTPDVSPTILYHYTDAAGLIGILSSGKIWATDYRYLNDVSEVVHTDALLTTMIADRMQDGVTPAINDLYAKMISVGTFLDKDEQVFIFSMTEERDSLSQWRGYASDGKGFCIGFDAQVLAEQNLDENSEYTLRKVAYDEVVQKKNMGLALNAIIKKYSNDIRRKKDKSVIFKEIMTAMNELVVIRGTTNKHRAFSVEGEWRLVSFAESDQEVCVRSKGPELIPYIELNLGRAKLPILQIGVGPGFRASNQLVAVNALCSKFGYQPDVYLADAPFRTL